MYYEESIEVMLTVGDEYLWSRLVIVKCLCRGPFLGMSLSSIIILVKSTIVNIFVLLCFSLVFKILGHFAFEKFPRTLFRC